MTFGAWVALALFLVSNRLPVSILRRRVGFDLEPSMGGLASGLGSIYRDCQLQWIGWPGDIPSRSRRAIKERLRTEFDCLPVFLPPKLARRYYGGFANATLWPLFHSFSTYARYSPAEWDAYRRANGVFARKIAEVAGLRDTIWIHDYHLKSVTSSRTSDAVDGRSPASGRRISGLWARLRRQAWHATFDFEMSAPGGMELKHANLCGIRCENG